VEGGGLRVEVWRFRVWRLGDLPWQPDIEGGSGAADEPTVVVGCGQNGGWQQRRPPGWRRRPVEPGLTAGVRNERGQEERVEGEGRLVGGSTAVRTPPGAGSGGGGR
jgi:hypothetical protein